MFFFVIYKTRLHKSKSRDFLARVRFNIGVVSNANAKSAYQSFSNFFNSIFFSEIWNLVPYYETVLQSRKVLMEAIEKDEVRCL